MPDDNNNLWAAYGAERSDVNRNRLIEAYLWLVEKEATNVNRALPLSNWDELYSAGCLGLIQAVERFDRLRNLRFATYAALRIKGSIIDEVRRISRLPRLSNTRAKRLAEVESVFASTHLRMPTDEEAAELLGLSLRQTRIIRRDVARMTLRLRAVEVEQQQNDGPSSPVDLLADDRFREPSDVAEVKDEVEFTLSLVPSEVREILTMRYLDDRTANDICQMVDRSLVTVHGRVSEGRRIARRVVERARSAAKAA